MAFFTVPFLQHITLSHMNNPAASHYMLLSVSPTKQSTILGRYFFHQPGNSYQTGELLQLKKAEQLAPHLS